MKMDLVNGDDTDFFHLAGHKATFFGKAFPLFFLLSFLVYFIQQVMNESKTIFGQYKSLEKQRREKGAAPEEFGQPQFPSLDLLLFLSIPNPPCQKVMNKKAFSAF